MLGFVGVLEGAEPGLLFEDGTIRRRRQGGGDVVTTGGTALLLRGPENSSLRVWGPVLVRLWLDHIVRYNRRTYLFVQILVVHGAVGTPPAIPTTTRSQTKLLSHVTKAKQSKRSFWI